MINVNAKYVISIIVYSLLGLFMCYHYLYFYNRNSKFYNFNKSSVVGHKINYINSFKLYDITSDFNQRFKKPGKYDVLKEMENNGLKPKLVSFRKSRNVTSESNDLPVPNIVHLVHYGKPYKLQFRHFLHMMGTHKFIQVYSM